MSSIATMVRPAGVAANSTPGRFGAYGGRYVPETLMAALLELDAAYAEAQADAAFHAELDGLLKDYCGRPTPLYFAKRLTETLGGAKIYLKREDLLHTGAHKINNALGQGLLARRMGKQRIIAETGAGQHGVATATVCALFGLECVVYMGEEDMRRQELNVFRMRLLGAEVRGVGVGLGDAEGCDQRGDAGLGYECSDDVLYPGERAGGASVSDDGAGFSARDLEGDEAADSGAGGAAAGCGDCVRGRRVECDWGVL